VGQSVMSHFNDRLGSKLTIAVAITLVVIAGTITKEVWPAIAPLAAEHYSVEMYSLFVVLLVVGMLLGWAWFSGFRIARSIQRTGGLLAHRLDCKEAVDGARLGVRATDLHAAKISWDNLRRIEQIEAEESHPRGAAQLADQFQAAVGTLIGMRSPALAEYEPSARVLTRTAETTQPLASLAANRSEASCSDHSVPEIASPESGASDIAREMVMQAAGHVDDALKSISAIAERINPPALAAVIAAVRAGEAGRGFAAVARELTVLAAQTATVLEQLGIEIGEMEANTQDASSASRTSRQASCAPEGVHRRSLPQWKSRSRDAGRPSRPRRRRWERL
jgi:hypothetical protein